MTKHKNTVIMENAKTVVNLTDKLFKEVDATVFLAGVMGATAAAAGLTPPLTKLLMVLNDTVDNTDWAKVAAMLTGPGLMIYGWEALFNGFFPNNAPVDETAEDKKKRVALLGCMAAGFMEGMIMMELVKNKEMMARVMDISSKLASSVITAAGEAVPF